MDPGSKELFSDGRPDPFRWVVDPPPVLTDDLARPPSAPTDPPPAGKAPAAFGDEAPAAVVADPCDALVGKLRKNRARTQAALLEFMKSRQSAEFQDIALHVHGDDNASDRAIRANLKRTNEALGAEGLPIRFSVGAGFVFKEEKPE